MKTGWISSADGWREHEGADTGRAPGGVGSPVRLGVVVETADAERRAGLPEQVVRELEERFWLPIQHGAMVENFVDDPSLVSHPGSHPALFSDHGVTHVRDIARIVAELAGRNDGVLIATRTSERVGFIRLAALVMTYLHDIGMAAPTASARRIHPQFAAQVALSSALSGPINTILLLSPDLRARLELVCNDLGYRIDPNLLMREIAAVSLAHSKSAVPSAVLNDRSRLRSYMQRGALIPLDRQGGRLSDLVAHPWVNTELAEVATNYVEPLRDAFAWLDAPGSSAVELADDVIDAVRLLRAADALRQRGVAMRTSGGFEICVDPNNGDAVYGLRSADEQRAALVAVDNPISAAESNMAFAVLGSFGELRIGFNRSFDVQSVRSQIVDSTADLIADIEADAIASFVWPFASPAIVLVGVPGDDDFTREIAVLVQQRFVHLAGRIRCEPADAVGDEAPDLAWMSTAVPVAPDDERVRRMFAQMAERGLNVSRIDIAAASEGLQLVRVVAGTKVLQPGTGSPLVLVPFGPGLRVFPVSGTASFVMPPYAPVGSTGVVRGGARNAAVVAEIDVDVAVISAETYLRHWFRPYPISELPALVAGWLPEELQPAAIGNSGIATNVDIAVKLDVA